MARVSQALLWLFVSCALAAGDAADAPDPARVNPGITIADIHGKTQRPFFAPPGQVAMVFFVTNDCPVSNGYAREIRRICEAYKGKASCTLDYVDPTLKVDAVRKHMEDYAHGDYAAVIDMDHALVKASGAGVTPEALVVRPGGEIAYRGRIDNKYVALGRARQQATVFDLRDAVDAVLAGRPVETARTNPVGCYITPLEFFRKNGR